MAYSFWITLQKVLKELAIWGLPQLASWFINNNPDLGSMTVAAVVSMAVKGFVDYLNHKDDTTTP